MKGFVEEPNKGTLEYQGCNDGCVASYTSATVTRSISDTNGRTADPNVATHTHTT
jgi:hypothetical protein